MKNRDPILPASDETEASEEPNGFVAHWRRPLLLGAGLLLTIVAIVPFLAGHSLHEHFGTVGPPLLLLAVFLLVALVISAISPETKIYSPAYLYILGLFTLLFGTGAYRYRRGDYEYNRHLQPEYHLWAIVAGLLMILLAYRANDAEH